MSNDDAVIVSSGVPFYRGRFFVLFVGLMAMFVLYPLLDGQNLFETMAIDALFLLIPFSSVYALIRGRRNVRNAVLIFAGLSFILRGFAYAQPLNVIDVITLGVDFVFYVLMVAILAQHVFSPGKVTFDRLFGAASIYLLLGLLWGVVYVFLLWADPNAFAFNTVPEKTFETMSPDDTIGMLIYFSYVTITTVGYGDLVPNTRFAGMLATLEALTGQLFIATLVARLVGLHIAQAGTPAPALSASTPQPTGLSPKRGE